jgi:hypothetical protein
MGVLVALKRRMAWCVTVLPASSSVRSKQIDQSLVASVLLV